MTILKREKEQKVHAFRQRMGFYVEAFDRRDVVDDSKNANRFWDFKFQSPQIASDRESSISRRDTQYAGAATGWLMRSVS